MRFTEYINKRHCRASVNQTICRLAVRSIYLGGLSTCDNTIFESSPNDAKTYGSINANTYEGAIYTFPGYSFICGGFGNDLYASATHCLESCRIKGQCTLAIFTIPFVVSS